jgi:YD repeat-containing protein
VRPLTELSQEFFGSGAFQKSRSFFYESKNHIFLTKDSTVSSIGFPEKQYYLYPTDYPANGFIHTMIDSNVIEYPIEQVKTIIDNNLEKVVQGNITEYSPIYPASERNLYALDLNSPARVSGFQFSNQPIGVIPFTTLTNTDYFPDGRYSLDSYVTQYALNGKIISHTTHDGIPHSSIYDYDNSLTTGIVDGADQTQIAYTSFETDSLGFWALTDTARYRQSAFSGKQSYTLITGKNIVRNNLDAGISYRVSYWSRSGAISVNGGASKTGQTINGWTFFEHTIPSGISTVTISGNNKIIDELRLSPLLAQVKTFTYDPLIGILSRVDENSFSESYEYDALGRLKIERDKRGNILKRYCYRYTGQSSNCSIN